MQPKELTILGPDSGRAITTIFTAANVYLGLKVGLTFASSIPAAVISMAIDNLQDLKTGQLVGASPIHRRIVKGRADWFGAGRLPGWSMARMVGFVGVIVLLYSWMLRRARAAR
jgi:uncharacterized oligopeptide transporter (OPT) family protein